ncbi:MAG: glycosyltransferase [Candidatus Falkowbacteria bacterium]
MNVALIHDHLAQDGGAEKVLKVLADMYPQAPIYTLLYEPANVAKYFKNRCINTSIIQRIPGGVRFYKWCMPIMPMAVEFFNLSPFDLVISDTSSFAKGVITSTNTPHICYCHTPTRYLWSDTHSYIEELRFNKYFKKLIGMSLNKIRVWDKAAADRVDYFVANSQFIAKRIKKYYRRESVVIYPPVEIEKFTVQEVKEDYYLAGGRLVPYKRFDLVIAAFKQSGRKLKIFGDGPDFDRLKSLVGATAHIEFLGRVSEQDKVKLYAGAKGFINPQEEDFGITMVEALASGTPVLAFNSGGAPEIVVDGQTGFLFDAQTVESLLDALAKNDASAISAQACRTRAEKFSTEKFKQKMSEYVAWAMADYKTW